MVDDQPLDTRAFKLDLTIPCDDRFRPVLSELCARMVRYVGYAEAEAAEVTSAVVHATDGVLVHGASPPYQDLDVTISTSESDIEFHVRYLRAAGASSENAPSIEHRLGERNGDEAPLDAIQRVMGRVEFGQDEGVEYCTLSKALPEETRSES